MIRTFLLHYDPRNVADDAPMFADDALRLDVDPFLSNVEHM